MNKNNKYFQLFGGGDKPQWSVLKHNGPMFPPNYIPHKTEILVKGKRTALHPQAEEYATMFARFIDTDYMQNNSFKKKLLNQKKLINLLRKNKDKTVLCQYFYLNLKDYLIHLCEVDLNEQELILQ